MTLQVKQLEAQQLQEELTSTKRQLEITTQVHRLLSVATAAETLFS